MIGLNYLGENWVPAGIDPRNWLTKPDNFTAFTKFASAFLTEISASSDNTEILLFTENRGRATAEQFRQTLGNLPSLLPNHLHKFRFVLHDLALWLRGQAATNNPNLFTSVSPKHQR